MGADNWGVCPRCKVQSIMAFDAAVEKLAKDYGKVPAEEYEERRAKLQEQPELEATLREDYESFISEGGRFYIKYSGHCQQCGFGKDFKIDEQLDLS